MTDFNDYVIESIFMLLDRRSMKRCCKDEGRDKQDFGWTRRSKAFVKDLFVRGLKYLKNL